jgi:DNA gyrase subunit A
LVRTPVKDISVVGRNTQGVRLIRLEEGDQLSGLERIDGIAEGVPAAGADTPDDGAASGDVPGAVEPAENDVPGASEPTDALPGADEQSGEPGDGDAGAGQPAATDGPSDP